MDGWICVIDVGMDGWMRGILGSVGDSEWGFGRRISRLVRVGSGWECAIGVDQSCLWSPISS